MPEVPCLLSIRGRRRFTMKTLIWKRIKGCSHEWTPFFMLHWYDLETKWNKIRYSQDIKNRNNIVQSWSNNLWQFCRTQLSQTDWMQNPSSAIAEPRFCIQYTLAGIYILRECLPYYYMPAKAYWMQNPSSAIAEPRFCIQYALAGIYT